MAINFPANPSNGDVHAGFTYNSTKSVWEANSPSMMATSDTAPTSPSDGQMWFDTDGGGTFVYYEDADSNQWVEVIGSQGSPGADGAAGADGGAGVASVYATVDNLPTSGNSQGDMAHVTANNTLYFWNGSGWYKIALINTNPSISGVSSNYALAIDGTATVVTVTASDPEGLPITYSIASDTSGNIATVTQGTGASSNVFTVTPSTNSTNAGSFTLTFRASDGVNLATAPASFTLQFSVENSNYTTALITSVGANNAVNNSFVDSSTNSHTITAAGNATQTTFSPYRHGGYSTYFDGSGDSLTTASAILSTSGAFTVQCWVYLDDTSNAAIWAQGTSGNAARASVSIEAGNWYAQIGSAVINTTAAVANVWKFLEFQYDGSQIELFVDGTSVGTASNTTNAENTGLFIGKLWAAGYDLQGYVTDFRVINGTPTGSSTVPTARLTAVANTSLLTCHLPYFADGSTNGHAITVNGNTKTTPFAPYDAQEYSSSSHGGSMYFDGSGDGVEAPNHTSFDIGSDDFTIETWFYSSNPDNGYIFGKGDGTTASGTSFWMSGGAGSGLYLFHGGSYTIMQTGALPINQWTHLAFVRNGTNLSTYINGTSVHSTTASITVNTTSNVFDIANYPSTAWIGNIEDFRFVKGTAVYTSDFTPPTAPLTAITNTSLLLSGTNAGIIDKSQSIKDFVLSGNVKSSTTQNKFLTTSMYFDGNGDYMRATNNDGLFDLGFNGEPFTIEWWQWWPTIQDSKSIGPQMGGGFGGWNGSSGHQLTLFTYSSAATLFYQWWNGSSRTDYQINHGGALTASTWQHFATVFDGTNLSTYVDGSRIAHRTSGNTFGSVSTKYISLGSSPDLQNQPEIYYSDVRITKGLARYSGTSFTVPSEALQG